MHMYACQCVRVCVCACACLACCFILETSLGFFVSAAAASSSSWRTQLFHKNSLTFNFSKQQLHESEKCMKKSLFLLLCKLIYMRTCKTNNNNSSNNNNNQSRRTPKEAGLLMRKRERERGRAPKRVFECV